MKYIIVNQKGGVGKSTFASHFVPEYILRKGKQETVKLFEFDEYSQTSEDYLKKSELIESIIISKEEIKKKIFNISFNAQDEDLIIDIGPGALVSQFVTTAKKSLNLGSLIFIVPYSDDAPSALLNTVDLIEREIDNPKILIALNKIPESGFTIKEAKKSTISLYGNEKYQIKPFKHLKRIEKYVKSSIPYDRYVFAFARTEEASLTDLKREYLVMREFNYNERVEYWKHNGKVKGSEITKEEYIRNKVLMQRQLSATIFLDNCNEFYEALKKLESNK